MSDGYTPVALYIHWPFCQSKCPYCDFNSHVRDHIDLVRWRSALLQELGAAHEKASSHRLVSVFFGGGTPSLCPPDLVGALIDRACGLWSCDEDLEVTLEANPGSSEAQRFKDYAKAGVNRLSLGVQSFD
ncbi:MAG: radical SAM protein, partial [Pseudomonadota bacterium]